MNPATAFAIDRQLIRLLPAAAGAHLARRRLMRPRPQPPEGWELPALAAAEPVSFRFGLTGLRWGSGGPVTLMLHGWEGRPTQFARFVQPLLERGRQVIALSPPAHGRSPGSEAHVLLFAQALQEAAAELRGVETVIGHSMGGAAALIALRQGLRAERAIALAAPSALTGALGRFAHALGLPADVRERFMALVDRRLGVPARRVDTARVVRGMDCPALLVHDTSDRHVPFQDAQRILAALPRSRLFVTGGLGHVRLLGDAAVIDEVVRFAVAGDGAMPSP